MKNNATGVDRIVKAAGFSWQGLRATYRHEAAFRQEVWLSVVLLPLSFLLASSAVEWSLLVGTVMLVLIVELLNSAVESLVDRFGEEWNELGGRAKDMGSAAVLLSLLTLGAVWIAVVFF